MTGNGHMSGLRNWLLARRFPARIWRLQPSDAIRVVQAAVYSEYFCGTRTADDAPDIGWPDDGAPPRDVVVHRYGPSALPDHEWVMSGSFSYRAPAAFFYPQHAMAADAGPAGMAVPSSLSRLGWRHCYGTSLPTRIFPPVARLYLGVPPYSRPDYWNALWPMLRDMVPVLEAKVLEPAHLTRNDSIVMYVPVEAAALADALACESLARAPADITRPPLTLRLPSGAGLAESPPGESFGQRRARQIAESYVRAGGNVQGTIVAFRDQLEQDGTSFGKPWKCSADFDTWLIRSGVRC